MHQVGQHLLVETPSRGSVWNGPRALMMTDQTENDMTNKRMMLRGLVCATLAFAIGFVIAVSV